MITMTPVAKFSRAYSAPSPAVTKKPLTQDRVHFGIDIKRIKGDGSAAALADMTKAQGEAVKLRETLQGVLVSMQKLVKEADDEITAATALETKAKKTYDDAAGGKKNLDDQFNRMNKTEQAQKRRSYEELREEWEVAERQAKRVYEAAQERLKKAKAARTKLNGVKDRIEPVGESIRIAQDLTTAIDANQIRQVIAQIKRKHKIS